MKTNELKCTDLRIGNFVKSTFDGLICEILDIYAHQGADVYCSHKYGQDLLDVKYGIEPILLTEEFFLKNGFKKEERINSILYYLDYEINEDEYIRVKYLIFNSKALPLLKITSPSANIYESYELTKRGVKYLHELQNAYYCLTNQEMEIEL